MHHRRRPSFARLAAGGFREAGVEVTARGRGDQPERLLLRGLVVGVHLGRQGGHGRPSGADLGPIGLEVPFAVGMPETFEEMRAREIRRFVVPARGVDRVSGRIARCLQRPIDQLPLAHLEAGMPRSQASGKFAQNPMVGPALGVGLDDLLGHLQIGVPAGLIDIVVFEERRRGQHDVGHPRGVGQELLVHANEQILAPEAVAHFAEFGGDVHRIGVLHEQRLDRRSVAQIALVPGQDRSDAALVERADTRIAPVEAFDHRLVEAVDRGLGVKRAAAFVPPGAGDRRQGCRRVHRGSAVAVAREAVAQTQEGAFRRPVGARELADRGGRNARDAFGPFGRLVRDVGLEFAGAGGVTRHVVAIGEAFGEQHMHDPERQCRIRTGARHQMQVGLLGRAGTIGIDDEKSGPAGFAGARDMRHHVDLRGDRIGAPNHDQVRARHLARVGPAFGARPRKPSRVGKRDADRRILARIAHRVAQALDSVALHEAHRPGVKIGPHGFGSEGGGRPFQRLGRLVERFVPRDRREAVAAAPFGADAPQRNRQPIGMVLAFGVARDLRADHAGGVIVGFRAAHFADPGLGKAFDLQRADAGAVVRAGARAPILRDGA